MAHAISLGARGLGGVWPNPAVGCVLVKGGRVIARGRTGTGGRPHAEQAALVAAGAAAQGAVAYVSLEPCAHVGQTPPCADALIDAGVARVVVPIEDPDARVAGQGIARLRAAGIVVDLGVLADAAHDVHAGFLSRVTQARPFLTLKLALTLDGRIATATGESRWITGGAARRVVHGMRMTHDAVLVGGGTARADNPTLTVRDMGEVAQPVRIVASRAAQLPWPSRLLDTLDEGPVWIAHGPSEVDPRWAEAGAQLVPVPVAGAHLDPEALMQTLGKRGLTRVFCEGGGSLAASLLGAGVVDELVVFSAGKMLGAEGTPGIGALGIAALAEAPEFELVEMRQVGGDILHRWRRGL